MKRSSWRWPNDRNPNNWSEYEEVVTVYLLRAYKDEPHREAWVQQALSYIDKMVSLAPSEPANLYSSAYNYERAGDLSKNGCPSYEKAAIIVREFEFVTEGRQSHGRGLEVSNQAASARERGLSKRLTTKIESWCITTGSPRACTRATRGVRWFTAFAAASFLQCFSQHFDGGVCGLKPARGGLIDGKACD